MKRLATVLLFILMGITSSFATHYRAGDMSFTLVGYLHYIVTVTTYTTNIYVPPDDPYIIIDWGDGTQDSAPRINGNGQYVGNNIKVNVYQHDHTYSGPLPYFLISTFDQNRIDGILNINGGNNTQNLAFYVEDTLKVFDPDFYGKDNSPVLLNPPIDFGNVNDTFKHNPAAFDPDGDSLSYSLIACKDAQGSDVPAYVLPDQINPGINNKFTIDARTGEIVWATPQKAGIYNIAILVREYRNGVEIGTVLRDMQIIIKDNSNHPPKIRAIRDTCVVAGTDLRLNLFATDPDIGQTVTFSAVGGPFNTATSVATFSQTAGVDSATAVFDWQTVCDHVRPQFYEVIFKATDDYVYPLVDLVTWIIRVVAPGPQNLQAIATNNVVNLTWQSPYACDTSQTKHFIGFSVWRREGPNPFTPDTCNPGLAGHGYTQIKDLTTNYSYADSNVVRGKVYCYRVQAEFASTTAFGLYYNRVPSLPSNEACANLRLDLPLITEVSVLNTDAAQGRMQVAWERPIANSLNFDTIQHPGPYRFDVFRAQGLVGATNQVQVGSKTGQFFGSLTDTIVVDTLLNTVSFPYNYVVDFYSNSTKLGSSEKASSVFLTINRNDRRLDLSWVDSVPWQNVHYEIFKLNKTTGVYDSLTTVDSTFYTDYHLLNDTLYCYKILSIGHYSVAGLQDPILNFSQEVCKSPHDTIAPCPPVLQVSNPCTGIATDSNSCSVGPDLLKNVLTWTQPPPDSCGIGTRKYNIYFTDPATNKTILIDSILSATDTTYRHSNNNSLAGCYAVTAIDTAGNESVFSNVVCVDNCPCYQLPNVFTPNNDGKNDLYTPINPYRFVAKVEMKIYNRWGDLVFETNDPNINWNGNDTKNNKPEPEDTYYYTCKVFEIRVNGIVQNKQVLSGFIHLIRGNGGSDK